MATLRGVRIEWNGACSEIELWKGAVHEYIYTIGINAISTPRYDFPAFILAEVLLICGPSVPPFWIDGS